MWVPSYFGSYEHLLKELLHNPFLGSGQGSPPRPSMVEGPQPDPWRAAYSSPAREAVALLVSAATAKEAAAAMSDKAVAKQIVASADASISEVLDDYCGTPPRKVPWPFPGPPPWVWEIASELTTAANSLQEGTLRTSLQQISGRILDRSFGSPNLSVVAAAR